MPDFDSTTELLIETAAVDAYRLMVSTDSGGVCKFIQAGDETFRVHVSLVRKPVAKPGEVEWTTEASPPVGYGPGTNTGHGHVWKRSDGHFAKCLGVNNCKECKRDLAYFGKEST